MIDDAGMRIYGRLKNVDLRATGTQVLIPSGTLWPYPAFIPQFVYVYLRTLTGTPTTAPVIKIGSNAGHTDLAPAYTVPLGAAVGALAVMPLASLKLMRLDLLDVIFEVSTAAIGPSAMTGDVLLAGIGVAL